MSNVDKPSHYNVGKIEVRDFIVDQGLDFCLGNAVKYICRAEHKGKKREDIEKAINYLQHVLSQIEEEPKKEVKKESEKDIFDKILDAIKAAKVEELSPPLPSPIWIVPNLYPPTAPYSPEITWGPVKEGIRFGVEKI